MKVKDIFSPILFIILGIGFLIVSLWVILGRNKNLRAIKYKYKLGGLILSLSFFVSACDRKSLITCYDPAVPDNTIYVENGANESLSAGDTISFSVYSPTYQYYSYQLLDSTSNVKLQEGMLKFSEGVMRYILPFDYDLNYTGDCNVKIYGEEVNEVKQSKLLYVEKLKLNVN